MDAILHDLSPHSVIVPYGRGWGSGSGLPEAFNKSGGGGCFRIAENTSMEVV